MEGDARKGGVVLDAMYFNPLPPHGGRLDGLIDNLPQLIISIHSLRMEGDIWLPVALSQRQTFQSTPSAWRETSGAESGAFSIDISIHSLRMEGDQKSVGCRCTGAAFQSTPSAWRETITVICYLAAEIVFQSTPSAWRETAGH